MYRRCIFLLLTTFSALRVHGADVYGSAATAQTIALDGIYLGSNGPTDALASNPAMLTAIGRPFLELTGMGILAGGQFHNSTPYIGHLQDNSGISGSAGFGMTIPHTRLSFGLGVFPVSLLSDRWSYYDPKGTAGASYGLQNTKSAFLALQSSAGLAFKVSDRLSLGASLGVVENLNTLEMPYVFQTNPTLAGLKTLLNLHTNGTGINGTFGLIAQPVRQLQIGLSYKTQTTTRTFGNANGNASAQFSALGIGADPVFHYNAQVNNVFPQSASVSLAWQTTRRLRTFLQGDWIYWRGAFVNLPVHLTNGNNAVINSLLNSTTLNDTVPLHWRNQFTVRGGFNLALTESVSLQGAYSQGNEPVPASTLTPLTAAIMNPTLSTGLAFSRSRYRVQFAYQANLPQSESVGVSGLLAGEFSNSRTSVWLQTLALTTGIRF